MYTSDREYSLSQMTWELKGFWPWVPVKGTSMEIGNELLGVTEWMPATVPGGVHYDLYRAGWIENPYQDMNSLQCEWVENRWWVYRTCFEWKDIYPQTDTVATELICQGLDYEALIYWNGQYLGEHIGMYEPAVFDITEQLQQSECVELLIVLKHPPDEMGQIGKTSATFTQKSRFNYKWDFSTRLINIGIWDDIVLKSYQHCSLQDIQVKTDLNEQHQGVIQIGGEIQPHGKSKGKKSTLVQVAIFDPAGNAVVQLEQSFIKNESTFTMQSLIDSPQLWYPNGYGDQPLYKVKITLLQHNTICDVYTCRVGIRQLEYVSNEGSPTDALPYTVKINGRKIYIRGANITPLDHLYGNVTAHRYEWLIHLAKEANMNMLRIWGGGIIEKSILYELCDMHGIMIWQEFIQSSSGIDNTPSQRPEFLDLLQRNAISALKRRRNHTSLTIWSGGNELMSAPNIPSTYDDHNLALLQQLVQQYDPQRMFLPTSASGPVQYITHEKGVSHDVHGHWKYEGNPQHYVLYGEADHLFHSEFGVDGLSHVRSLHKFLSQSYRQPTSMEDSLVWRHHGEWWDTYSRDIELFGSLDTLESFVDCSQWIQAEGLRFILDSNRSRQFNNSGSLVWQLNEPWPNVTCTNLIDYYNEAKMAYYWVKEAYAPFRASIDYRSLHYVIGETVEFPLRVVSNHASREFTINMQLLDSKGQMLQHHSIVGTTNIDHVITPTIFCCEIPQTADQLFYIRLQSVCGDQSIADNMYPFSTRQQSIYAPTLDQANVDLAVEAHHDWTHSSLSGYHHTSFWKREYTVTNQGNTVALHIYPYESTDRFWMTASEGYFTLFPGESKQIVVTCCDQAAELFPADRSILYTAKDDKNEQTSQPEIAFASFQQHAIRSDIERSLNM
ncbi:glycoside hydrolase family 2 TIM barrel-domain containing protein [Paenibacillus kyungheensis]|uniref:beta-mannosidase n=1 Tax=Paenibacillus kyungheensis TaxID=1452732 RepID=A0AAX3M8E2_9BACL|nr:glycoside hydrolase family 2 TIM barrel-domain containing protein [Paenibacillus kyungheensis]WCT58177.1 glycoside hydrolase family 2 TIM barrel-domain containing protein [Paenibacillus kyungheensis]